MSVNNEPNIELSDILNTVKKQSTYEIIIEQLQELIFSGAVKPGQKLPGERVLSEKLGSSRNSVRLAIKLLEFMNLLEVRPGSGVYVTSKEKFERASINYNWRSLIKQHPLMELIEARKCFEPFMAELAAQNATKTEIEEMEKDLENMEADINSGKGIINQATKFHELIFKASKNIILNQIGLMLHNLSDESKRISLSKYDNTIQSLNEHKKILEAIKNKNPGLAAKSMTEHLQSVEEHLRDSVAR